MANVNVKSKIDLDIKIILELSISEARALNEMVKYGDKAFLEGYYKQLGKSYMQPYENGVKSLFTTIKENLPYKLRDIDQIKEAIGKIKFNS